MLYQIVVICIFVYLHARQNNRRTEELLRLPSGTTELSRSPTTSTCGNPARFKMNQKNKIMVVLGCGMEELQNDRITTAVEYVNNINTPVIWYLAGGVKHAIIRETEASKMKNQIKSKTHQTPSRGCNVAVREVTDPEYETSVKYSTTTCGNTEFTRLPTPLGSGSLQIVLDENSTNTAENFAYLKKWMGETNIQNPEIIITTSAFHKERAEKIFNGIMDNEAEAKWILSSGACPTCWNDEKIHMVNVNKDVDNAKKKIIRSQNM